MESFVTYVNKGCVKLDMDYFPEFEGLSNEEIAQKLADGKYYVNDNNEIMPATIEHLSEEIKEDWKDVDGNLEYDSEGYMTLWEVHNESDVDFDKIKNEEHYFLVTE